MKITIPGTPVSQARMRVFRRGGYSGVFDPNGKDKVYVRGVLKKFVSESDQFEQFLYPRVTFKFYMPIPKGVPKKQLELYLSERRKHDKKPDCDNLIKLYLDCLDDIFFTGDQRVSLGPCLKVYSATPRTVVWIDEMSNTLSDQDLDYSALSLVGCDKSTSFESDCPDD